MVALLVLAIVGAALTRLVLFHTRFYAQQTALRGARMVSRSAENVLQSELRMVEATGGVVSADSATLVLRVPYAFGIVCLTAGATTTLSLLPADSITYAQAGFSGYAWRDSAGSYTYVEGGVTLGTGVAANCTSASITTLTGGRVVTLSPALPAVAGPGMPVFLFQRLRYAFDASTLLPGRVGLWRTVVATGAAEEIAAPFDATSRFKFFVLNRDTSQNDAPNPLADTRGIDLVLDAASERTPQGSAGPKRVQVRTAVFFRNRLN